MTKKKFDEQINWKEAHYLSEKLMEEYFQRLITPYRKGNEKNYFIVQYLNADGNELRKKFWSKHSSSRFAFELYSWMANDKAFSKFYFEYKLKGLKGSEKQPNMDVYFEKGNNIVFIESKFSELTAPNLDNLSSSYDSEDKNGHGCMKYSLEERYWDKDKAAKRFSKFINDVRNKLVGLKESTWMDYKQEITHLVGIYLTIAANDKYYKDKDVKFYNIYYDFECPDEPVIGWFFKEGEKVMKELLVNEGLCKSFEYKSMTAQEVVKDISPGISL